MISLRRILAVLKKELLQLKRDRMTFGMVVMLPLVQLMLFGYAINTNVRGLPVGLVDKSGSDLGMILVQMVEATQVVQFTEIYDSAQEGQAAVVAGRVRAVLVLPEDLTARAVRSPSIGLAPPAPNGDPVARPIGQWVVDGSDTMVAAALKGLRNMPLAELMQQAPNAQVPTFETTLFFNPEQRSEVNIIPGLVGVILTMTMVMFTSAAIVRETERGNMEMLINTPVRPTELMIGKIIPYMLIGYVQMGLILGVGHLVFDVPFNGGIGVLLVVAAAYILACLSIGLMISTIAKNQLQAMQMTMFVILPSILLSGFMFPYEGMPKLAQYIADIFPATHFMVVIRGVVLRDAGIVDMAREILWLLGIFAFGMIMAGLRFRKRLD